MILGGYVSFAALQLGGSVVAARVLAPEGRGQLAFILVTATLAGQVCEIGGEQVAMQLRSTHGSQDPLRIPALRWSVVLTLLATATIVASRSGSLLTASMAGFLAVTIMLTRFLLGILTQDDRNTLVALLRCLPPSVLLVTAVAMERVGSRSPLLLIATALGANGLSAVIGLVAERRSRASVHPPPKADFSVNILATQLGNIGIVSLYRIDQFFLGILARPAELGYYVVVVNLSEALQYVPVVGATLLVARGGTGRLKIWVLTVAFIIVGSAALIMLAPTLVGSLYGSDFERATPLALPLVIASAAFGIARLAWGEILVRRNYWAFAACSLGTAILFTPAWLAAIDAAGAQGAAWVTTFSYCFFMLALIGSLLCCQRGRSGLREIPVCERNIHHAG